MLKSARESKVLTSWMNPNEPYEAALSGFVNEVLARRDSNLFLRDLQGSAPLFAWYGALNGLTLAGIKCLSPGVPDFYQGHAAIELSLMDPDNRRPVDRPRRRELLQRAEASLARPDRGADWRELLSRAADGEAKFRLTWAALQLRRARAVMLRDAEYLPLAVQGERAAHAVAFARRQDGRWIVVVATRLYASLGLAVGEAPVGAVWGDTTLQLPADAAGLALTESLCGIEHTVTAQGLPLAQLLRDFPVALLTGDAAAAR
jgi:(1->4)-alpha-D-glucan 1-alpha-D-glucosylmutase